MILQDHEGGLLLFRQTDHALLSGAFAAAWGNETVPEPTRRAPVLVAATRHDDGWAEWELAPTVGKDGRPIDFIHVPIAEHVALYRRGIDLVEAEDPYAGLIVSLHGERLYTRPFYPGMDPRIEHLSGPDLERAQAYVAHERERQSRLATESGAEEAAAEEAWRLLQVWDRLSLLVCMQPLEQATGSMPPIATEQGDVRIEASGSGEGELLLAPYPFAVESATFRVEAVRVERSRWSSTAGFRQDFRTGEPVVLTFTCRSA